MKAGADKTALHSTLQQMNIQLNPNMNIIFSDSGLPVSGGHTTTSTVHCLITSTKPNMCVSTQTDLTFGHWLSTLAPKLCLHLFEHVKDEHMAHEITYNNSLGIDLGIKSNTKISRRKVLLKQNWITIVNTLAPRPPHALHPRTGHIP